ncbi:MAG TPA: FliH/SctL family protein [Phycisphaerae bacterium]|nr:FliH/SctL family protein [Phycisphaerae bacterium]HNU46155.1 FliH/SctL family protein [Phycisphaerae bacterium]
MATVIKAGSAGPLLNRLTTVDLADHLAEARAVVEQARQEATRIVAAARQREASLFEQTRARGAEQGYQEGFERGQAEGRAAAHTEAVASFQQQEAQVIAALRQAITQIEGFKTDLRLQAERDLLEFAVEVARKLTFAVGRVSPEAAQENFRRALERVAARTSLTVRVHPDDVDALRMFAPQVLEQNARDEAVKIVPDAQVTAGGCIVEHAAGQVDATLETQLEALVTLLLGREARDG